MATQSTGAGFDTTGVGGSTGIPGDGASAAAGVTGGDVSATKTTSPGEADYVAVVEVPIPFANLNVDLNLVGAFVLPVITAVGIPKAMQFLIGNITNLIQNVIDDVTVLLMSIPDSTFTIQIKLGPAVIYSVQLVASKVPLVVTPPTFQLALPNFAVDASLSVGIPGIPGSAATVVNVPIPVPVFKPVPLLGISGGQVSAGASTRLAPGQSGSGIGAVAGASGGGAAAIGPSVEVPAIQNPISLPHI